MRYYFIFFIFFIVYEVIISLYFYQQYTNKLFYFDPFSKESIADVLLNVIKSPNLRKIQTKRNYEFMKYYGWGRVTSDTYRFIDSCVGE